MSSSGHSSSSYFKRLGSPIVARATSLGGPVAIVRISGKNLKFLESLISGQIPDAGTFAFRPIQVFDDANKQNLIIDKALVLSFKAPASFTGEDVIEIQGHGVSSVVESIIDECVRLGAVRALPGEFSFRAVLNEKMTLEEAEALQTAFGAEGLGPYWASQLLAVRRSGQSGVSKSLQDLLKTLAAARGRIEAAIDFPEAESEQGAEINSALDRLQSSERSIKQLLTSYENFVNSLREVRVAIVGSPNAGKSTLLNILAGGRKALVSPVPGTTRDVVEAKFRLSSGEWIRIFDTAGIRSLKNSRLNAHDSIEKAGIDLGLEIAADATMLILVRNAGEAGSHELDKQIRSLGRPVLEIYSHKDLVRTDLSTNVDIFDFREDESKVIHWIRPKIEQILKETRHLNFSSVDKSLENESPTLLEGLLSERQERLLQLAENEIGFAKEALTGLRPIEIAGEHVRSSEDYIRRALGQDLSEDYIGEIFTQFCLGK